MTNSVNLPAPYQGVDQTVPKAALQSPFCENLLNFNTSQAGITLRNGDVKYKVRTLSFSTSETNSLNRYGDSKLYAVDLNKLTNEIDIYDVDTGTLAMSSASGGTVTRAEVLTVYFNKYLFFFTRDTVLKPGYYYNGTAFGSTGYTGSGTFWPYGGNVYNNRGYFVQYNEAAYWYTGIDAISGACTKIDLSGIVSQNCYLMGIASITVSDAVTNVVYQSFIFSNGEVLFYSGAYPDSSTWSIVGRAQISQPISRSGIISYQGDALIICDAGLIGLREVFIKGAEDATHLTSNSRINETWRSLIQAIRVKLSVPNGEITDTTYGFWFRGLWDTTTDRLVISFPFYLDTSGVAQYGSFYFVFDVVNQSWFFHRSFGTTLGVNSRIVDIIFYKNKVLILGSSSASGGSSAIIMVWQKEGSTGFMDRNNRDTADVGYDYNMLSAPIPFPKTAVYEATQIEPILESDLYAETNYNFVVDFGRQTSGNQTTDAATTAVSKPAVNVGMQNITFVQTKMSGTTTASKTVGLNLYSSNVWYNSGEIASR